MPTLETAPNSLAPRPGGNLALTFCLHLSADGRRHQLSCVAVAELWEQARELDGWSIVRAGAGSHLGIVHNHAGTGCRWIWLGTGRCDPLPSWAMPPPLLSHYPMRPLLTTISDGVDLCPAQVDAIHRALLVKLPANDDTAAPRNWPGAGISAPPTGRQSLEWCGRVQIP